ncbi:putative ribonuclease H-like domain-containing protein [Tanacetum coccineum]
MVPRAVLRKSSLVSINTARQVKAAHTKTKVNDARPMSYLSKKAHSTVKRPIHKNTSFKISNFNQKVTAIKDKNVNTIRPKAVVNTARPKASAYYKKIDVGYVAFGGNPKGGKITGKGTIKTSNLDFKNMYFMRELKFNLFSVSQICDKKNSVLFNDTECIVLSSNFKLIDESQVLLRVPRKNNMYSVDLKNIVPKRGLTCLFAKATSDESKLWHRRLGHLNFKTMNKLVKGNLVRGLPSKLFENDQTCVACQKGKQHRASCKSKTENSISLPLHLLHMDLFGPTFVKSLMKKMYCLVVIDDFSRFTWVFFLATKDETSGILKSFITGIENLVDHKVKVIRCDNGTEFKNKEMNQFCEMKGILRQYSVARTPQQNGVAERRNRTLIEAARTMFSESTPNVVGTKASDNAGQARKETKPIKDYILLPLWTADPPFSQNPKSSDNDGSKPSKKEDNVNSTNNVNATSTNEVNAVGGKTSIELPVDPNMSALEDYSIFDSSKDDEDVGAETDMNNLDTTIQVSPIPTTRIHKDYPIDQVIGDLQSATQTRNMLAIQKELLQFKLQEVWTLVDLPIRKRAIGSKWVFKNKKNERLVAQGYTQEKGIDYDEFFAPIARIEAIRLFLAYASFKDFVVYQMDVKSVFLYGKIEEKVAWYETLSTYLLDNEFQRGKIDKTLFIKRHKDEFYGRTYILLRITSAAEEGWHLY